MLAGYLTRGLVIGFYEDSVILSRHSKKWSIDGAVIAHKQLGSTYRVSLGLKFGNIL